MSTKTEKVWVIVHKSAGLIYDTVARTKSLSISEFSATRGGNINWCVWRRDGHRCVRATLTYEVPDER